LEIRSHELFAWAGLEPDLTFQIARITDVSHCAWLVLFSIGWKFLIKIINHDCEKPWEERLSSWPWGGGGGSHASPVSQSHSKSFIKLERMKHKRFYEGGINIDEWKRTLHRCTPGNLFTSVSSSC
jgi:hypothetical protein